MGRRGKYTDEWRITAILQAIRSTGQDKAGIEAGDISSSTFYRWMDEKAEFRDKVERARRDWAEKNDAEIAHRFRQHLLEALAGPVEVWETKEVTELPDGQTVTKKSTKRVKKPPAKWAFDIAAPQVGERFGIERSEVSGPDGGPQEHSVDIDFSRLTDQQLAEIAAGADPSEVAG